jgi:hypothetical protein
MDGWIKLHRQVLENGWLKNHKLWVFWSYCLLKATHCVHKTLVGNQQVELQPGQFVFGLYTASEETGLTIQNIRTCLKVLKFNNQINIQPTNKFSIITILNWGIYQNDTCCDQQADNNQINMQLTSNQQATNNKQECKNNIGSIINNTPSPETASGVPVVGNVDKKKSHKRSDKEIVEEALNAKDELYLEGQRFASWFYEQVKDDYKYDESVKLSWIKTYVDLIKIDKKTRKEIADVCQWARQDSFWKTNFYSPCKLRNSKKPENIKYIDYFLLKMKAGQETAKPNNELPGKDYRRPTDQDRTEIESIYQKRDNARKKEHRVNSTATL